ncbi:Iguana/Dzip1-like DAZ-interacting protein N-terminal-domain-containing protein [Entophlyctis helioformis]|nr:Iguana/Dzip1-like DAZ-interacting protein N-terminal-domain-containing protein [Entophlyctis helioformis]
MHRLLRGWTGGREARWADRVGWVGARVGKHFALKLARTDAHRRTSSDTETRSDTLRHARLAGMAPAHAVDAGPHAPPASHGHGAPRRHSGSHSRTRASTRHAKHSASAPSSQSPPSGFRPPHKLHAAADADEGRSAHGFRSGHRPSPDSRHHPRHAAEAAEHPDAGHNNSNNNNALLDSFFFRRRRERLNWRMLAAIDADRVMRDVDVPALQEIMENVTFCDIDAEDLRYIDPNFVKLFRLAQMMIEYLLHSQDYLADQRAELRQELDELRLIHRQDTESIEALTADSDAAKKELRTLRKTLYAYQLVAKLPGGISQNTSSQAVYHRCMHCPKVFSSQQYLDAHLQRRHSEHVPVFSQHPARHNDSDPTQAGSSDFQKMADMIERFSIRLLDAEKQMRGDSESKIEDRVSKEVAARKTVMEDMYKQERLRFEKELQDLKASIHKQLTEERAMLQEEKEKFESYMEQELRKKSHVGVIEDDDDQVKPAKAAELVSAPTPTPPEPPKPTIEELQKIQAAQAAQLAKEMEERQEMALKSVQDRIAQELGSMRSSLITQHEQERMALEQQLASAATEIHEMRELLAHHHETDLAAIMAAAKAAAAASATAQPESVQTLPRTSQLSQQTSEQSTPAVPMEQPTEPKVKLNVPRPNLRVSISAAPQTPLTPAIGPAAVSVVPEKTASSEDNLFTELNVGHVVSRTSGVQRAATRLTLCLMVW